MYSLETFRCHERIVFVQLKLLHLITDYELNLVEFVFFFEISLDNFSIDIFIGFVMTGRNKVKFTSVTPSMTEILDDSCSKTVILFMIGTLFVLNMAMIMCECVQLYRDQGKNVSKS